MITTEMLIVIFSILVPVLSGMGWIICILMDRGYRLSRLEGYLEAKNRKN